MENKKPRLFYGYVIVIVSCLLGALAWGNYRTFGVFLEPLIGEFGWSRATVSFAFTLSMLFTGIFGIVVGRLNDRLGPRLIVTVCGVSLGLGYILMSLTRAIWQPYLFQGLFVAIGMSGIIVPMVSTVARWFAGRGHSGLMTGIVVAGPGVGITLVPLLARRLISAYDWRTAFVILGTAAIVLMLPLAQFLRPEPRPPVPADGSVKSGIVSPKARAFSFSEAAHTRQFWLISLLGFGAMFNVNAVMVHIVIHASDIGIESTRAVSVMSIASALSIAGRIMIGFLTDRLGARRTITACFCLTLVAFVWLIFAREIWMLYIFAAVFGLGGWMGAVSSPMVAEMFGMTAHGAILGVTNSISTIGGALGPVLAGFIFDIRGGYQVSFIISAVISVTGICLALLLRPTRLESKR